MEKVERALFPEMMYAHEGGDGIVPRQELLRMVAAGQISAVPDVSESQIQPSSIDLRLGPRAYRVQGSFLKGRSATLMTRVKELTDDAVDLTQPTPPSLTQGMVYIIPLLERLNLPAKVSGVANPKSTTGRLDIFTRLITECGDAFDQVPEKYSGELYLEVSSRTFPIRVRCGMALNQLRFVYNKSEALRNGALRELAKQHPIIYRPDGTPTIVPLGEDGVEITVDLTGDNPSSIVAYRAKDPSTQRTVELAKINHYNPADYWDAIPRPPEGYIILKPYGFYLLASKNRVSVPRTHAAEMVAYDSSMGEFRVHYAGFFDPGFGYGSDGEILGTKAVLEIRAYEVPILLEDDHVVGRLRYFKMASTPDRVYGTSIGSSYQQQGLALSKQFKRQDLPEDAAIPRLVAAL